MRVQCVLPCNQWRPLSSLEETRAARVAAIAIGVILITIGVLALYGKMGSMQPKGGAACLSVGGVLIITGVCVRCLYNSSLSWSSSTKERVYTSALGLSFVDRLEYAKKEMLVFRRFYKSWNIDAWQMGAENLPADAVPPSYIPKETLEEIARYKAVIAENEAREIQEAVLRAQGDLPPGYADVQENREKVLARVTQIARDEALAKRLEQGLPIDENE